MTLEIVWPSVLILQFDAESVAKSCWPVTAEKRSLLFHAQFCSAPSAHIFSGMHTWHEVSMNMKIAELGFKQTFGTIIPTVSRRPSRLGIHAQRQYFMIVRLDLRFNSTAIRKQTMGVFRLLLCQVQGGCVAYDQA